MLRHHIALEHSLDPDHTFGQSKYLAIRVKFTEYMSEKSNVEILWRTCIFIKIKQWLYLIITLNDKYQNTGRVFPA